MSGYTRDFLNKLEGQLNWYDQEKEHLAAKAARNPHAKQYIQAYNQLNKQFKQNIEQAIANHIKYLSAKDPYGRQPLPSSYTKKELFRELQQTLDQSQEKNFSTDLRHNISLLRRNPIIDQPRWPSLSMHNLFYRFQQLLSPHEAKHPKNPFKKDK